MTEASLRINPKSATLRHLVEDKLRSAIVSGVFRPGERLIERDLCERLGVGRTSVREALRQLEADGLVTTVPHRGPTVTKITVDEARQLYEIRSLLESHAGRTFAQRGLEADRARLNQAVDLFLAAADTHDQSQILSAKADFYEALTAGAGNVFLTKTLKGLNDRIMLLRITSMMRPGRLQESIAEIKEIHRTILVRDGDKAAEACRLHVENAASAAIGMLQAEHANALDEPSPGC